MSETYVFGYGSLMNEESLQNTLPEKQITSWAILRGHKRIFNKIGNNNYRYMNLRPVRNSSIRGVLIKVTEDELDALKKREEGYTMVDVKEQIETKPSIDAVVYVFIAPPFNQSKISGSYLNTVLAALPPEEREQWLKETDFEGSDIDEDG